VGFSVHSYGDRFSVPLLGGSHDGSGGLIGPGPAYLVYPKLASVTRYAVS